MGSYIKDSLLEAHASLTRLIEDHEALKNIQSASELLVQTFSSKRKVFSCGNGGSMADAIHFAEELTGKYRRPRRPLPALAISDPGHITCVGNDYGFSEIFSRFIEAHGETGDCLLAISTSGDSTNILRAVEKAKAQRLSVIGLTGNNSSSLAKQSTVTICTPAGDFADRVQELHIKVLHILIEMVERHFFPENYV